MFIILITICLVKETIDNEEEVKEAINDKVAAVKENKVNLN
jgi:hypothetical protein